MCGIAAWVFSCPLTGITERIDDHSKNLSYAYDKDNRVTSVTDGSASIHYTYDAYGRVCKKETKHNGTVVKTDTYSFQNLRPNDIYTSSQVSAHTVTVGDRSVTYSYTYDDNGNITSITCGEEQVSYTYDSANQLLSELYSATDRMQTWQYNESGNIILHTDNEESDEGDSYQYNDTQWGDWLSVYNGKTICNDNIGNMLSDGTWDYSWKHGRQLKSMTKTGESCWTFTYNADGLRTKRTRTVNDTDTEWEYVYNGSQLTRMVTGDDTLYFAYDANGVPMTVTHKTEDSETTYYYVTNIQGDVLSIVDASGVEKATYAYDAWGNPNDIPDAPDTTISQLNPLRYRGYIYDTETGLYYLQSRYYNPQIGRFINADGLVSTGQGILGNNMFAYCLNNPVNMVDTCGCTPEWILALPLLSLADGPLPAVDTLAAVVFLAFAVYQIASKVIFPVLIVIIDQSSASITPTPQKDQKPIILPTPTPKKESSRDDDTLVYRWAKLRNSSAREYQNLTPRPWSDDDGLSFSLVPTTTKENATTTLGALRSAGFICTVKENHVSVMPAGGVVALGSWKHSYNTANSNPHELTQLLYGITW